MGRLGRYACFGLAFTLIGLGFLGLGGFSSSTLITQENYDKLRIGMTELEVNAILGGASRDESTGPTTYSRFMKGAALGVSSITWESCDSPEDWIHDIYVIRIGFNQERRVSFLGARHNERICRTFLRYFDVISLHF
jgi:hypothetical protein